MAKDDYYTIAAKILVYLYKKYQHKEGLKEDYITPGTADFPISQEQLYETIDMLCEQGYITGNVTRTWGGDILVDISSLKIQPSGIDYMLENRQMNKVLHALKEASDILLKLK